ncbi:MAG: hypothetical protein ACLQFW_24830 [Xanthobacteraceae bacterium]
MRLLLRSDAIRRQRIANNLVILFGVEGVFVNANAGAACRSLRDTVAEPLDHIGAAVALECNKKTAGRHFVIVIVAAAPGVDIQDAVGTEGHLAGMAKIVREDGRAEAGWKRDAAIVGGAGIGLLVRSRGALRRLRDARRGRGGQRERGDE